MGRNVNPKPRNPLQQDQRRRAIYRALCDDYGGEAQLGVLQRGLLRQAAIVLLRVELAEISLARGEPYDEGRFASDVALAIRILGKLGGRRAAPASTEPSLQEYIAQFDAEKAAKKALGFDDEEPATEISPVEEAATPPASILPEQPVEMPAKAPVAVRPRQEGVEIHELARLASEQRISMSEALERNKKQ